MEEIKLNYIDILTKIANKCSIMIGLSLYVIVIALII